MAVSWFQRPQAHHWTWYFNAGRVAKEIDPVLIDEPLRMILNSGVYWSVQFLNTNHRVVEATLKFVGVCTGSHTFQGLYGLDSWEDFGVIRLRCIVWECQDL